MNNNIKNLRCYHGLKQIDLSKKLGISQGTLSSWENGKYEPDTESLKKLSNVFNVSIDYIIGNSKSDIVAKKEPGERFKIPVLGKVQAGLPITAVQEILDYEEITPQMAKLGDYFALQVRGNSMEPRMYEGDVVIIRQQPDVDSGTIAVVLVEGECATVKKILKHDNGISLISFNPKYEPVFFTNDDIKSLPVTILGKVVELRAKF